MFDYIEYCKSYFYKLLYFSLIQREDAHSAIAEFTSKGKVRIFCHQDILNRIGFLEDSHLRSKLASMQSTIERSKKKVAFILSYFEFRFHTLFPFNFLSICCGYRSVNRWCSEHIGVPMW